MSADTRDDELTTFLNGLEIRSRALSQEEHNAIEQRWLSIYQYAFQGRPRLRRGTKAEHAYLQMDCEHLLVVPFTNNVSGLAMGREKSTMSALECWGPLPLLGQFCTEEFFISPTDLHWTMIHTHEDHAFGGPYFLMQEWIP